MQSCFSFIEAKLLGSQQDFSQCIIWGNISLNHDSSLAAIGSYKVSFFFVFFFCFFFVFFFFFVCVCVCVWNVSKRISLRFQGVELKMLWKLIVVEAAGKNITSNNF